MHPQVISVLDLEQVTGDLAVFRSAPTGGFAVSLAPCDAIPLAVLEDKVI